MGPIAQSIESKLTQALSPDHMELVNESHQHSGPAVESHFRLLISSMDFEGLSRIQRQRKIFEILDEELKSGVHALTIRALTPGEFKKGLGDGFVSPVCHGGSKT